MYDIYDHTIITFIIYYILLLVLLLFFLFLDAAMQLCPMFCAGRQAHVTKKGLKATAPLGCLDADSASLWCGSKLCLTIYASPRSFILEELGLIWYQPGFP